MRLVKTGSTSIDRTEVDLTNHVHSFVSEIPCNLKMSIIGWFIANFVSLLSGLFLVTFVAKLGHWIKMTFFSSNRMDLRPYGAGHRHSWAIVTGASDGIGAAFAKVKFVIVNDFIIINTSIGIGETRL